jgi:hypothetical protein
MKTMGLFGVMLMIVALVMAAWVLPIMRRRMRERRLVARRRFAAMIAVVATAAACMAASGGCGSDLHKAETAAGGIAASLSTAAQVNHTDPLETPAERALIAGYIVQAAAANDNFIGVLKTAEAQGGTVNVTVLASALAGLTATVGHLEADGVLRIKDPASQAHFAVVMSSIQAAIATIQALYPGAAVAGLPAPAHKRPWLPLMAIVLTPEEIEELIALAVAAGSALVPKLMALQSETGAEILTGATADDAAAEKTAELDELPAPATAADIR